MPNIAADAGCRKREARRVASSAANASSWAPDDRAHARASSCGDRSPRAPERSRQASPGRQRHENRRHVFSGRGAGRHRAAFGATRVRRETDCDAAAGACARRRRPAHAVAESRRSRRYTAIDVYVNRRRAGTSIAGIVAKKPAARLAGLPVRQRNAGRAVGQARADASTSPAIDPAAKPFSSGDKERDKQATADLATRARRLAGAALCRPALQAAGRAAGHRHERQGRHDPRRVRRDERARRAHGELEGAVRGGARARLPVAHPPEGARGRRDRDLQPQPLRGRPRAGGVRRLDHAGADPRSATTRSTTSNGC